MILSHLDREVRATADLLHGDDPFSLHDHLLRLLEIKQEEAERLQEEVEKLQAVINEAYALASPVWYEFPPETPGS